LLFLTLLFGAGCGRGADMAGAAAPEAPAVAQPPEPPAAESDEFLAAGDSTQLELQSLSNKSTAPSESGAPPPPPRSPPSPATGTPERVGIAAKGFPGDAAPAPQQSATLAASADKTSPLLIYSATLAMAVFGTAQALDGVEALARAHKGYLVKRSDTSITIRVPADTFEQTLTGVSKLGDELHRDVSVRDVTEEFTDLEVRLRNAEVVRQRLEALLAKAGSVEDALAVERELARLTQSIELWKGKLKLLRELVAFSTITVNFQVRSVEHVKGDVTLPFDWLRQLGLSNLLSL
jgi:hypothetical protein